MGPVKGKISGSIAKKEMVKSKLPNPVLAKVWRLSDVDADGALDSDEFALAMHLIHIKLEGYDLPTWTFNPSLQKKVELVSSAVL